jgi:membrane protease YdiL (CAAX protease family)
VERANLLAIWFLFIFGLFVPYLTIKSARAVRAGATVPPRKRIFLSTIIMLLLFLVVSLFAAREAGIDVFARGTVSLRALAAALAMLAICLAIMPLLWRTSSDADRRRTLLTRPQQTGDLGWWFLVSLAAGTVEEITYRGVMVAILLTLTRSWWLAVAISVLCFTLGHANQCISRMLVIAAIALGCHLLVLLTGALYLAMAVHFTYDFLVGIIYVRFAKQMPPAFSQTSTAP